MDRPRSPPPPPPPLPVAPHPEEHQHQREGRLPPPRPPPPIPLRSSSLFGSVGGASASLAPSPSPSEAQSPPVPVSWTYPSESQSQSSFGVAVGSFGTVPEREPEHPRDGDLEHDLGSVSNWNYAYHHRFRPTSELPPPEPFLGIHKDYPSALASPSTATSAAAGEPKAGASGQRDKKPKRRAPLPPTTANAK